MFMKRILIFSLVTAIAGSAYGQTFDYGVKAGLNIAKLNVSAMGFSATSDELFSFHAGVYGTIMTSEKFGIQPELIYSGQGGAGSGNFVLGYLNVPVMLRYEFSPGINIQGGPQVGFLLNATVDGMDAKSAMNTVDFGLGFGLGVDRPSGVNFGFRYVLGLSNTFSSESSAALAGFGLPGVSMMNQVMQFSVGYKLSGAKGD